jgi:hypothetical protein
MFTGRERGMVAVMSIRDSDRGDGDVDIRVTLQGEPPTGQVTRQDDGAGMTFVGWGGLLRALAQLAGEAPNRGEAPPL